MVINKCVTAVKVSNFSGHCLRKHSTLDIGALGYIGIVQHKEHCPEVLSIPPVTLCVCFLFIVVNYKLVYDLKMAKQAETCRHRLTNKYDPTTVVF